MCGGFQEVLMCSKFWVSRNTNNNIAITPHIGLKTWFNSIISVVVPLKCFRPSAPSWVLALSIFEKLVTGWWWLSNNGTLFTNSNLLLENRNERLQKLWTRDVWSFSYFVQVRSNLLRLRHCLYCHAMVEIWFNASVALLFLTPHCTLFYTTHSSLFNTHSSPNSSLPTYHSLTAHYSLLTTSHSSLLHTAKFSLFTIHCSPPHSSLLIPHYAVQTPH